MPIVRCTGCDQPYDVPPAVATKLPSSIARCTCGKLLFGNREVLVNQALTHGDLPEIDVSVYRVDDVPSTPSEPPLEAPFSEGEPISVRINAMGAGRKIDDVFTIDQAPLYIGRMGCHVQIEDAELSIRHCRIERRDGELWVVDEGSHTGTYMDGEAIAEARLGDGVRLIRAGGALVAVETTEEKGQLVEPVTLATEKLLEGSPLLMKKLLERGARSAREANETRLVLVCVEGPCSGNEYDIPPEGGIVGRQGTVRIPDEFLSRKHFAFIRDEEDGTLRIRDLGSSNGTFLNTLPARDTRVRDGDEVRAGYSVFRLERRNLG